MTKNLQDFYTKLKDQGVRLAHQYQLTFESAPSLTRGKLDDITLWAEGAQAPGREQNVSELQYLGYSFIVPTNFTMTNELTLNIRAQSDLDIHHAIFAWMSAISDPDIDGGSAGGGDKTLKDVRARLDMLDDKMENITTTYELVGIYPTVVEPMEFTNVDPDIATFSVTFRYQYWKTPKSASGFTGI